MSGKIRLFCAMFVMMLAAVAAPSFAQNQGGGGGGGNGGGNGGGGGGGGGGGRQNFQQMRQQMMDQLKTDLAMTDDEFAAVQPKIEKVQTMQRDAMGGGMFGRGGRGGRGGQGGQGGQQGAQGAQPTSAVQTASDDLKKTLDVKESTPDDIKGKLEALRTAKKAAKEDLTKAQEDLKSVLTARQEAVLVQRGMLE